MIERLPNSPAGARVFYDSLKDRCILEYPLDYTLIYSKRVEGLSDKLPFCFKECNRVEGWIISDILKKTSKTLDKTKNI